MHKPDVAKLSDEQLVELVRTDNKEMYREVVERYQAPLLRYVIGLTRDEAAAADVVQNSFIKAYVNLNGFKTKLKFSSWLYRIAHNETMNHLKKAKREVHPDDASWFDTQVDVRPDFAQLMQNKERRQALNTAIAKLDLKYREPLLLYYFQHKSYEEISDLLRLPTSSVGTRIRRAKGQLKELLRSDDG